MSDVAYFEERKLVAQIKLETGGVQALSIPEIFLVSRPDSNTAFESKPIHECGDIIGSDGLYNIKFGDHWTSDYECQCGSGEQCTTLLYFVPKDPEDGPMIPELVCNTCYAKHDKSDY